MTDKLTTMTTITNDITEITTILAEEYLLGMGATPATALGKLAEDLSEGRLNHSDMECTPEELLISIGNLLTRIAVRMSQEA
jgi:hypothetical protein